MKEVGLTLCNTSLPVAMISCSQIVTGPSTNQSRRPQTRVPEAAIHGVRGFDSRRSRLRFQFFYSSNTKNVYSVSHYFKLYHYYHKYNGVHTQGAIPTRSCCSELRRLRLRVCAPGPPSGFVSRISTMYCNFAYRNLELHL